MHHRPIALLLLEARHWVRGVFYKVGYKNIKLPSCRVAINTIEDINRILLPLVYLAYFKYEEKSLRICPCLNGDSGVQRIPSSSVDGTESGHELQDTNVSLAFPPSMFSVTEENGVQEDTEEPHDDSAHSRVNLLS